jgi:radical SAM protein with 4Fe4S-binding SPASM domain
LTSKLEALRFLKNSKVHSIEIGTVATRFNILNLEEIFRLVNESGIDAWHLFRPIPNKISLYPIESHDVALLIESLITINKKYNKNYNIWNAIPFCAYEPSKVQPLAKGQIVNEGYRRLTISPDGAVRPMYYFEKVLGNFAENRNLRVFWKDRFISDLRNLRLLPAICKQCRYAELCLGGSRAVAYLNNKSYYSLDYLAQPLKYSASLFV